MWNELWASHRGTCIGVASGVFFGLIYLIFGFWDMLIFAFIVYTGYAIGKQLDRGELSSKQESFFRWLNDRWRMFK